MTALAPAGRTRRTRTQGMPRCPTTFPELRSQRDDMDSGRRSHPDTCRCVVRGNISATNCGAGVPRFCLVCQEAVEAASYNSALTAIGSGSGKRKRKSDLLPAHGEPGRCSGSCIFVPAFAFRGVGVRSNGSTEFSRCAWTPRDAARHGQPQTARRRGQGVLPGRRTKTRPRRYDSQVCISAVIMVDARLSQNVSDRLLATKHPTRK